MTALQGEVRRMLRIVASEQAEQDALKTDLDALMREGARRMLLTALKAEVDEYVASLDEAARLACSMQLPQRWIVTSRHTATCRRSGL